MEVEAPRIRGSEKGPEAGCHGHRTRAKCHGCGATSGIWGVFQRRRVAGLGRNHVKEVVEPDGPEPAGAGHSIQGRHPLATSHGQPSQMCSSMAFCALVQRLMMSIIWAAETAA